MIQIKDEENDDYFFPLSDAPNVKLHDAAYTTVELTPKYIAYMDPAVRFTYTSSRGNQ